MLKTLINVFKVPELRNKVLFTIFLLAIYRIGYQIPLPGVDQETMQKALSSQGQNSGAFGRLAGYVSLFSGGSLSQSTIFGLGIMPYISASIIFQLLGTVVPSLEKLQKEGETGRRKIQEWTRYATIPLCIIQGAFWLSYLRSNHMITPEFEFNSTMSFWLMGIGALTTGCIFLMWLGEQIDEYGLGNGISLIIMAGIVARMPNVFFTLIQRTSFSASSAGGAKDMRIGTLVFLALSFVVVVAGSILITQAQRRIPIQQAKHTRGRRVYGGSKQYLPLRVNHGGVMPIIFAQSLMLFPTMLLDYLTKVYQEGTGAKALSFIAGEFGRGAFLYVLVEMVMIYFFAYFWTTVQFQPKEMANNLRDYGSFIPGRRPGPRTAEYLEFVMLRITYVGAAFLCVIAAIPGAVGHMMKVDWQITAFLGGTGLLIAVSVSLDMVQRIEANLMMRNYGGFLAEGPGQKGKRIKGRQY